MAGTKVTLGKGGVTVSKTVAKKKAPAKKTTTTKTTAKKAPAKKAAPKTNVTIKL